MNLIKVVTSHANIREALKLHTIFEKVINSVFSKFSED